VKLQDRSRKTFIAGLERLLAQIQANEPELPDLGLSKVRLQQVLEQVKLAERRREILLEDSRRATADLWQHLRAARDLVSRIESLLRANLGPRNELLLRFGIALLGSQRPSRLLPGEKKKGAPPATSSSR
jgi:hypothetical protein